MDVKVLDSLIKKKFKENCISNVIKVDGQVVTLKGENYCSVIIKYRLEMILNSGEKCVKNLIVKKMPPTIEQVKFIEENGFFKTEIQMYATIIKLMEQLMEEFEDRRDKLWCEMIAYNSYDTLILEDIHDKNFKLMSRKENLDLDHSMLVMRSLARYHAMSKILLSRNQIGHNEFPRCGFTSELIVNICFKGSLTVLEQVVQKYWGPKWAHLPEKLRKARDSTVDLIDKLAAVDESRFNVLNHGDCWSNNMMFKHVEGTNVPCAVKFLDYQLAHYNSFAWDVTYFLYNSTKPEIRRKHFNELIATYHKALCENLEYFNFTENNLPTLQNLQSEMKRIRFFSFLLLTSIHAMTTTEVTDAFDMQKTLQNLDNPSVGINIEIFKNPNYREKVGEDIQNYINDGII